MGFAYRGITHCEECGTALRINEFVICEMCNEKNKEKYKYKIVKEVKEKMENKTIEITMEEYKELLMIKGKYEELKSQNNNSNSILVRGFDANYQREQK